jgi:CRISPR/Cas system-associated endoribonuclease Cas2
MKLSTQLSLLTASLVLIGSAAFAQNSDAPPMGADPTMAEPATPPTTAPAAGKKSALREAKVNTREDHQAARIEQGVKSGELNAKEAANLQKREEKIKADEAKAMADGKMTKREAAKINREQNRASRKIHAKKHNGRRG